MNAPNDWYYHLFPLQGEENEALSLDWVVETALQLIDRTRATGDEAHFGPTLHWAHLLKTEQGPDGDWPAVVNARTGAPLGPARTRAPATLLACLGELLQSSEFETAIARAHENISTAKDARVARDT